MVIFHTPQGLNIEKKGLDFTMHHSPFIVIFLEYKICLYSFYNYNPKTPL